MKENIHWNDDIKAWCKYVPNKMSIWEPITYTIFVSLASIAVLFQNPDHMPIYLRWGTSICLLLVAGIPWAAWLCPEVEVECDPPMEDGGGI
jgi:hypothetical protein